MRGHAIIGAGKGTILLTTHPVDASELDIP